MRLADALTLALLQMGVKKFFGVTGRGSLYLSDALARNSEADFVPMMHEQSAGFAALGYTGVSRKPSVCLLSSGVGSTNALTPLLCAWQDQLPVIFISGQNFRNLSSTGSPTSKRTYGEQELDLQPIVQGLSKKFVYVDDPATFERHFAEAIDAMTDGRPGPIWIDIPLDLQSSKVTAKFSNVRPEASYRQDPREVGKISGWDIDQFERPIVLLGPSINLHPERSRIVQILHKLGLPVIFESGAETVFPVTFQNSLGAIGTMGGIPLATAALENADVVIGIGTLLRTNITGNEIGNFAPRAKLLIFDYDPTEIPSKLVSRSQFMGGSPAEVLELLTQKKGLFRAWIEQCQKAKASSISCNPKPLTSEKGMDLHSLAEALPRVAEENAIFVTDSGFCEVILPTNSPLKPNQHWVHPFSQGSMGFGTGGAIGASHAFPDQQIVLIIGDGSLMMNPQDLHTISQSSCRIKVLVIDNDMYGIIRLRQESLFRGRTIGVDESTGISSPNWASLSEGFGIPYFHLAADFSEDTLARLLSDPGPSLIRIQGSLDQEYWVPKSPQKADTNRLRADTSNTFLHARDAQLELSRRFLSQMNRSE